MDDLLSAFSLSQSQSQPSSQDTDGGNHVDAGRDSSSGYGLDIFGESEPTPENAGPSTLQTPQPQEQGSAAGHTSTRPSSKRKSGAHQGSHRKSTRRSLHAVLCKLCGQKLKGHNCPFKRPQPPSKPKAAAQRLPHTDRDRYAALAQLLLAEMQLHDWEAASACLAMLLRHYNSLRRMPHTVLCGSCLFLCTTCQIIVLHCRTQLPTLCPECLARSVMNADLFLLASSGRGPTLEELLQLPVHVLQQVRERLVFRCGRNVSRRRKGRMRKKALAEEILQIWRRLQHSNSLEPGKSTSVPNFADVDSQESVVAHSDALTTSNTLPEDADADDDIAQADSTDQINDPLPGSVQSNQGESPAVPFRFGGYSAPDLMATFRNPRHSLAWRRYHDILQRVGEPTMGAPDTALDNALDDAVRANADATQQSSLALACVAHGTCGEVNCAFLWQALIEVMFRRDAIHHGHISQQRTRFLRKLRSFDKPHAVAAVTELALQHIDACEFEACHQLLNDAVGGGWLSGDPALEALCGCVTFWMWKSQRPANIQVDMDFSNHVGELTPPTTPTKGGSLLRRNTLGASPATRSGISPSPHKRRRSNYGGGSSAARIKPILDAIKRCLPATKFSCAEVSKSASDCIEQDKRVSFPTLADLPASCIAEMYILTAQFETCFNFLRLQRKRFANCPSAQGILRSSCQLSCPRFVVVAHHSTRLCRPGRLIQFAQAFLLPTFGKGVSVSRRSSHDFSDSSEKSDSDQEPAQEDHGHSREEADETDASLWVLQCCIQQLQLDPLDRNVFATLFDTLLPPPNSDIAQTAQVWMLLSVTSRTDN